MPIARKSRLHISLALIRSRYGFQSSRFLRLGYGVCRLEGTRHPDVRRRAWRDDGVQKLHSIAQTYPDRETLRSCGNRLGIRLINEH
jgi:hypothetical protein